MGFKEGEMDKEAMAKTDLPDWAKIGTLALLFLTCFIGFFHITVRADSLSFAAERERYVDEELSPLASEAGEDFLISSPVFSKTSAVKNGWKKKNNRWYYYENGERIKEQWRDLDVTLSTGKKVRRRFYFRQHGAACTSVLKYNGKYYTFNERGMLNVGNGSKIFKVGNNCYCPGPDGACRTGWIIINNKLYYANKYGRLVHDKMIGGKAGIRFQGIEAVDSTAAASKLLCMNIISNVTTPSMSKPEKLKAVYDYVVNTCDYVLRYNPVRTDPLWMKQKALEMLTSHGGDCISYACAFAGLASSLGYKAKVIYGRVPGTRDQAPDGFTTHCWVLINGLQYDPEGESAGWNWDAYATYDYTFAYQVTAVYDYATGLETGWY